MHYQEINRDIQVTKMQMIMLKNLNYLLTPCKKIYVNLLKCQRLNKWSFLNKKLKKLDNHLSKLNKMINRISRMQCLDKEEKKIKKIEE